MLDVMLARLRAFVALLADEPAAPEGDRALALFSEGHSIAVAATMLAPKLGGPALIDAQRAVEQRVRSLIHRQVETIAEQRQTLEEWQRYAAELEEQIVSLEEDIRRLRAALAAKVRES